MRVPPFRIWRRAARTSHALKAVCRLGLMAAAAACASQSVARAQRETRPRPVRPYSVDGRVSLPNDRPAVRARVKLSSRSGISRETVTNDNGRFEFTDVPPGVYYLSASSLTDVSLTSEQVEADTTRTAVEVLTVNLYLRAAGAPAPKAAEPAVISLAEVGQKVPKGARKAFQQGIKLMNAQRLDEARESITRAIELYPEYFQALTERGDIYAKQRKLPEASEDFARALKVNPLYPRALRGAGYCKLEGGEFVDAARYLVQAASLDPGDASTHLLAGIANLEMDRRDAARRFLQQALRIDPARAVRAHIYLANLYARERQYRKAADELRLYLEAVPADPEAAELSKVEARWRAQPEEK